MSKAPGISHLGFFASPSHECSYLPDRLAVTMFADPHFPKDHQLYTTLSGYGFRRSGEHLYRPRCRGCHECIPVRVPVNDFKPNRTQRRIIRRNTDLEVIRLDAGYVDEHFDLYNRYMASRHPDGGMDNPTAQGYMDFLTSSWAQSSFVEFRLQDRLLAVAVMDHLDDGLSAVYTFFDPDETQRSLGTHAVLAGIERARESGLDWLYLGFWIRESRKMRYKGNFRPIEAYRNGRWLRLNNPADDGQILSPSD